jgi:hypothetical protein
MKFYLDTIEQIRGEEEGTFTEYGKREQKADEKSALTAFYTKLTNVSNSESHVYLDIKIVNSEGGCIKRDTLGAYIES